MSSEELKNIYKLTNSVKAVLADDNARHMLKTFNQKTVLGGPNEMSSLINIYEHAGQLNKTGILDEKNVEKLVEQGLPYQLDMELREAAAKHVKIIPNEINVCHRIQHHCVTEIETLAVFDAFRKDLFKRITK
ncbi:uncharacterized protein [Drosophila tropicalis]|uniref:uncharacterized protein n=1 Tax=Drosophila tropicalis TaxID=46794 RepID=UPI0035AC0877